MSNPSASDRPPGVVQDLAQTRALVLLSVDSLRWAHDWAAWRVRFAYDNDHRGAGIRDIGAFLRETVVPHCQKRVECADNVLYLLDPDDVKLVYRAFGTVQHGPGAIASIQGQESYRQALHLAGELAAAAREADGGHDAEVLALPDLSWDVVGFGQSRVATAQARGHKVVVRLGMLGGQDVWMVDVNGHSGCAQFRLRLDAMSKMGVAAALKSYELRLRQSR